MKALTLWQPWASLVALGVKTIETRSWSTSYRGPLAIHASKHPIREKQEIGDWEAWPADSPGQIHPNHGSERPGRIYCNKAGLSTFSRVNVGSWWPLPLGAVVATCTLVDVVPTAHLRWTTLWSRWAWQDAHGSPIYPPQPDPRILHLPVVVPAAAQPYGDFSPGRYAWLFADIEPLAEPIPAKGRQGLWEWTPPAGRTVVDLMAALEASLDAAKAARS